MSHSKPATVPDDVLLNQSYAHQLARLCVRPLIGTSVRPNHLTVARMFIGLAACTLLALGTRTAAVWSGSLWVITCLLDRADGELARMGDLRSESGKVLDFYSDLMLDSLWFLAAGIGISRDPQGQQLGLTLGVLSGLSLFVCIGVSELYERRSPPGIKMYYGLKRFHPDDALFLLAAFTWLGWLFPLLVASSFCTPLLALVILYRYGRLRANRRTGAAPSMQT